MATKLHKFLRYASDQFKDLAQEQIEDGERVIPSPKEIKKVIVKKHQVIA